LKVVRLGWIDRYRWLW